MRQGLLLFLAALTAGASLTAACGRKSDGGAVANAAAAWMNNVR